MPVYEEFRLARTGRLRKCAAATLCLAMATVASAQADFTSNDAITTLQIYADGGDDLVAEVSLDVLSDLSAVSAYCMAAGPARTKQKVAVVHGILVATEGATGGSGEKMATLVQQCCPLFTSVSIDERIRYGSELALEARRAFFSDSRVSGRMKTLVSDCSDEVLNQSFAMTLGSDRIGLFIAQTQPSVPAQYQTASGPDEPPLPDYD